MFEVAVYLFVVVALLQIVGLLLGMYRDQIIHRKNYEVQYAEIDRLKNHINTLQFINSEHEKLLIANDLPYGVVLSANGSDIITKGELIALTEARKSKSNECQN